MYEDVTVYKHQSQTVQFHKNLNTLFKKKIIQ